MEGVLVEGVGYLAAVVINISVYPQARKVQLIVASKDYNKLSSLSIPMFSLQTAGCILWLIYAFISSIYPIMFGSIMCFIPSLYILCNITYYKKSEPNLICEREEVHNEEVHNEEIKEVTNILNKETIVTL